MPALATVSAASVNLMCYGMTLYRGVIRVLGTFIGGITGLVLIALFPQEQADEGLNYCVGCASCLSTPRTKIESIV